MHFFGQGENSLAETCKLLFFQLKNSSLKPHVLFYSCGQQTNIVCIPTDAVGAHNHVQAGDGQQVHGTAGDFTGVRPLPTQPSTAVDASASAAHLVRPLRYEHELHGGGRGSVQCCSQGETKKQFFV
jgi:hypothetical protein